MIPAALEYRGPLAIVRFREPQSCVSWAVVNGGRVRSSSVAWYFLDRSEYPLLSEPVVFLSGRLADADLAGAVGLITSRKRYGMVSSRAEHSDVAGWCTASVGLHNALRAGDSPDELPIASTINLLFWVSSPLTPAAELEALTVAAEARTAAVLDGGVVSSVSGRPATGTGTDCVVLAHPGVGEPALCAGKHTSIGYVIARAVYDAVQQGVREWLEEFGVSVP